MEQTFGIPYNLSVGRPSLAATEKAPLFAETTTGRNARGRFHQVDAKLLERRYNEIWVNPISWGASGSLRLPQE
jgi:hypothetical protein